MLAVIALLACSTPAVSLHGNVVDLWGRPLAGATVVVEGVVERWQTDPAGAFSLSVDEAPLRVLGAAPGHMRAVVEVPEGSAGTALRIELWPEPRAPGFYAVGSSAEVEGGLLHLAARAVTVQTTLTPPVPTFAMALAGGGEAAPRRSDSTGTGLPNTAPALVAGRTPGPGNARVVPTGTTRFLHKSTLDPRAFRGLELRLSRLEAWPSAVDARPKGMPPMTALGEHGWMATAPIEVQIEALPGKDCYLVEVPPLADGVYAFHTGRVLDLRDGAALAAVPKERWLAWGFQVGAVDPIPR